MDIRIFSYGGIDFINMVEEHVTNLIPGYAAGSASKEEREQVETHLKFCEACRDELNDYNQVVNYLPYAVKTTPAPPELKQKLILRAREESRQRTSTGQTSFWDAIRAIFNRNLNVWAGASLVLVAVLFASNVLLWERLNNVEDASQSAMVTVALRGTDYEPDASGMLVMSRDGEYGVLIVDGLPELSEAEQYQLWLIQDGVRTSGGVFSVNEEGYGSTLVASSLPLSDYNGFGITIEPKGGSSSPTGAKVLGS